MTARREHKGAAPATTLAGNISSSDTTILLTSGSNWPTGAVGNFFIVIDRGNAGEEKVLCSARSTNTVTATTRGVDDTAASAHTAGVAVEHCLTAIELDQANQHQADTAVDDHTQYLNTTRHDVTARHTFGAALPTPAAPTTSAVGDAAAAGSAAGPARADHTHGRESFATPAIVLGTAAAAGAATTPIRSNSTIAAFDATVPTTSAVADAAATGSVAFAARRDHVHGREAFAAPTTQAVTSTQTTGTATTINHSDHDHGFPAAAPRGTLASGYAQATSAQTGISAVTDLTSLTITVTTVASRRYRISAFVRVTQNTSTAAPEVAIQEGATILNRDTLTLTAGATGSMHPSVVITPSAASHTYKLTLSTGAGTVDTNSAATQPSYILIEDIGT